MLVINSLVLNCFLNCGDRSWVVILLNVVGGRLVTLLGRILVRGLLTSSRRLRRPSISVRLGAWG